MHRFVCISLFVVSLAVYSAFGSSHRGLWVVRYTLLSEQETKDLVITARELNITDLYVQVRALGKIFFVDDALFTEADTGRALKNFKYLLNESHEENIRVHAWINAFYIYSGNPDLAADTHLLATEQKYLLRTVKHDIPASSNEYKKAGIEGFYIDPINKKNLTHINNLIRYLSHSLSVDGIHLDYFRYPDFKFSFSPAGRTAFILSEYVDPINIYNPQFGFDSMTLMDKKYKEYLKENIAKSLYAINKSVKDVNKKLELSIAVKPNPLIAKNTYIQDWTSWLEQGLCDKIILMNYNSDDRIFYDNIYLTRQFDNNDKIIVGISTFNQQNVSVIKRLNHIGKSDFAGFTLFSYNDLRLKPDLIKLINKTTVSQNRLGHLNFSH